MNVNALATTCEEQTRRVRQLRAALEPFRETAKHGRDAFGRLDMIARMLSPIVEAFAAELRAGLPSDARDLAEARAAANGLREALDQLEAGLARTLGPLGWRPGPPVHLN